MRKGYCAHANKPGGCDYGIHDVTFDDGKQAERLLDDRRRGGKQQELWGIVQASRREEDLRINDLRILRAQDRRKSQQGRWARWQIGENKRLEHENQLHQKIADLKEQVRCGKRQRKVSPSGSPNTSQ